MKVVILAGGYGTRISEESAVRPKPMVEIGDKPILWHIMKMYAHHGINEFIICCGYKGHVIKEYFINYHLMHSDYTVDLKTNEVKIHRQHATPWKITLVDTGLETMTGGRLKRVKEYIGNETFCMTYGDGVSDVNIRESIKFHEKEGAAATLTAVRQPGRFGAFVLTSEGTRIQQFREKPQGDGTEGAMINGGFFVLDPSVFDLIENDETVWEREPMEKLTNANEMSAYVHHGFWQAMDSLRDKHYLETLWSSGKAPWKVW
ncbi:glucose-1-phosphate cytidylyltransferase [Cyclobacterium jeungdonense]|uniref:Glucose-1-phosphate cytidylyltransferase n=1 Tax=Cyclobacterium jeungdonense TaxID=708087 RepID=A0ABT8C1R3_9BACT|nr:glucose-1-phosphate cytidylyltransferase [Cyclobacterium jeungdonense]MDN3686709.1 glucose-1-phosphate cytidylyltransferase [Cyclobacterium jeungdonense]